MTLTCLTFINLTDILVGLKINNLAHLHFPLSTFDLSKKKGGKVCGTLDVKRDAIEIQNLENT